MKRLIITLSIIAMLGAILPGLPILAQPIHLPHENPNTATSSLDTAGLLLSYSQIINLATNSQYQNARDILDELEHINIPDDLRYIINQYSELCQRLFSVLDNLEPLLDEASDLLARNQIHEVRQRLDNAEAEIQNAYTLLKDIEVATNSLSDKLGVFAISATGQLTQAHTRLEESVEKLRDLIDKLNSLKQGFDEQYVQKAMLLPTKLSLSVNPASAYVGDGITACGRLSIGSNPLPGKRLSLTLDNNTVVTAITGSDGSYATSLTLPYKYVENMTLTAIYEPSGNDADIYLAGESPPVTITTMFYQTMLEVSTPPRVYHGLPFTISGEVTANNDNVLRNIQVFLDDTKMVEEMILDSFSFEITPPEKATTDTLNLTVAVSPQGRYSGASESRSINVSILPIYIDTKAPSIVILPGSIQVSGMVYSELGPLADATIRLNLNDASVTTRTSADGSFNGAIQLHILPADAPLAANPFYVSASSAKSFFDLSPVGMQKISIDVEPFKSRATATSVKRQFFTINLLSTAVILAVLAAPWLVIRRRSRVRTYTEKEIPTAQVKEVPAATPLPAPRPKLTGIKGQVLSAYRSVLATVENITGVIMSPGITLREFLKIARLPSPTATERFTELTAIAESTLYSAYSPRKDTATRAEELAANIKEELHSGTP